MMEIGKLGVFCFTDSLNPAQLTELAQQTERLGYGALWYPEALSYESFALGGFLLQQTTSLIVAAGIANIYARDATTMRQGQHTLASLSGGRFLLGLGVSHVPLVEDVRGHKYKNPVPAMSAYLDAMDTATAMAPALDETPPVVLAALGPKMIALASSRTDGAFPYLVTPEHTAGARAILGPDKWLCVEQKVLLVTDPNRARQVAREALAFYMPLPNYRNNWLRLGFTEADITDGGSDRFVDGMVAWGDSAALQQRVQEHFDAGASHVCLQALNPGGQPTPGWEALAALAPKG